MLLTDVGLVKPELEPLFVTPPIPPLAPELPVMAAKFAAVIFTVPPWFQIAPTPRPPMPAWLPAPPPPPPPPPAPRLLAMTEVPMMFTVPVL